MLHQLNTYPTATWVCSFRENTQVKRKGHILAGRMATLSSPQSLLSNALFSGIWVTEVNIFPVWGKVAFLHPRQQGTKGGNISRLLLSITFLLVVAPSKLSSSHALGISKTRKILWNPRLARYHQRPDEVQSGIIQSWPFFPCWSSHQLFSLWGYLN